MKKKEWVYIETGTGIVKATLQYTHDGVYYWVTNKGHKFLTHDLQGVVGSDAYKPERNKK